VPTELQSRVDLMACPGSNFPANPFGTKHLDRKRKRDWFLALAAVLLLGAFMGCAGVTGHQTAGPTASPNVAISPSSLSFGSQALITTSAPQTLTLSNSSAAALTINSVTITGTNSADFSQTNNCPISSATLAAGATCTINVTFKPSVAAGESAAVSVSDNAAGSPQSVSLSGTGSSGGGPPPAATQLPVGVTVQEAVYSGVSGVDRTQDPVTVGIPISDSNLINNVSQLGLNGSTAGQFRILGRWPSGNIKWVLVDTLADVPAGGENTSIILTTGSGNFGGSNLATDNGTTISVNTGTATFTIKKANYNLIDQAVVNGRTLVASGTSTGLVVVGPTPGNTTCPCSTTYSSSNDPSSQAVIEENGPVRTVVKSTGQFKDPSGNAYMRYTVRMHFYQGKSYAKTVVLLQNADYGASNTFASAYKGFSAFEARLTPALGPDRRFSFGSSGSNVSGSLKGSEDVYLYQAYSNKMEDCSWAAPGSGTTVRSYIRRSLLTRNSCQSVWAYQQEGYKVMRGGGVLASGAKSHYPEGWAELKDSSGAGVEIGIYQMAAYWPKSLQFMNGGSEIRIGVWPDQSLFGSGGQEYFQAWPQYSMQTLYIHFHSSALSDSTAEFRKFQYPLIARALRAQYNDSGVLFYPIIDAKEEDNYLRSLGIVCCIADVLPHIYRTYDWRGGGGGNQAEMRWADLIVWIQRGYTGRYVNAEHFYAYQVEQVFPRSDNFGPSRFRWRDRPASELGVQGFPENIHSLNDEIGCDAGFKRCGRNWIDMQHAHWYGMVDYYFMTGDETVKDAIEGGVSDAYANPRVPLVVNGGYWASRDVGVGLMSDARLYLFYSAIGDSASASNALLAGDTILNNQIRPELSVSGYGTAPKGISRTRGLHFAGHGEPREAKPFQQGILSEALWEFLHVHGTNWPEYEDIFDLAYGVSSFALTEAWRTNGNGVHCNTGSSFAYEILIDQVNSSLLPSCAQTGWFNFYNMAKYSGGLNAWVQKFKAYLQHLNGNGTFYAEYGLIFPGAVIYEAVHPQRTKLVDVSVKVASLGGGSYSLSWIVPVGAQNYRIKLSEKRIVEWLNFDPTTNAFGLDPSANVPWFAATNVPNVPPPQVPGNPQTFTVSGLDAAKTYHFALKAYVATLGGGRE